MSADDRLARLTCLALFLLHENHRESGRRLGRHAGGLLTQLPVSRAAAATGVIEIELANGQHVRVGSDVNLSALRRVLACWRHCASDPGSGGCADLDCHRTYRHASRDARIGAAGAGRSWPRSVCRRRFRLSRAERGRTKTGYFWAIAHDGRPYGSQDPPIVVFAYAPGRGAIHGKRML